MSATASSDKDLVRQILNGQRDAFAALVDRYLQSALAVARARLLNPTDADDAVQEAFLRAFAQLRTLREPAKFGPWLLTIVRHEAARFVVRRKSTLGADATAAPEAATTPDPSRQEVHALLRSRIEQLPESAREVLLLHYFAGRTTREIAELLDLRQAAVLKRLQRAREALAENLLHELEAERPAESSLAKQAVRIAALATAIPIAGTAAASASASAAFLMPKGAAIAVAIIGMIAVVAGTTVLVSQSQKQDAFAQQTRDARSTSAQGDIGPVTEPARAPAPPESGAATAAGGESGSAPTRAIDNATVVQVNLDQRVTLAFAGARLAEILTHLENTTGTPMFIDRRAVGIPVMPGPAGDTVVPGDPYPTDGMLSKIHTPERLLPDAVADVTKALGLRAVWLPNYVWISSPNRVRRETPAIGTSSTTIATQRHIDALSMRIDLDFDNIHITDVFEFFNDSCEINIVLDTRTVAPTQPPETMTRLPDGKLTDGIIPYLSLRDVPLSDLFDVLTRMTDTVAVIHPDYIWITGTSEMQRDGIYIGQTPPNEMYARLQAPITAMFEESSINEILRFVNEIYDMNILVDQRVIKWRTPEPVEAIPFGMDRYAHADRNLSPGFLDYVSAKNITLRSALDIVTRQLNLIYRITDRGIVVTNRGVEASAATTSDLVPAIEFVAPPMIGRKPLVNDDPGQPRPPCDDLRVREIQLTQPDTYMALIDACGAVKWYSAGEAFEKFRVQKITARRVEVYDEVSKKQLLLFLP